MNRPLYVVLPLMALVIEKYLPYRAEDILNMTLEQYKDVMGEFNAGNFPLTVGESLLLLEIRDALAEETAEAEDEEESTSDPLGILDWLREQKEEEE